MTRRRSITHQILVFALLTCASVLLPVGGGLFVHHYHQTQTSLTESLTATARITANNVAAALAFGDKEAATELLVALHHDRLISSATLYDQRHHFFAGFTPPNQASDAPDPYWLKLAVIHEGVTYGELVVTGNIGAELANTALTWAAVYAAAFLLAGLTVFVLARRFQRCVATPIIELADTAKRIAQTCDYRARAPLTGCCEVAELADALNALFAEINQRDTRLDEKFEALQIEIRDRLAAEETLRQNQHVMSRLAREAGMAEVASGVIHNIGNTLTSISISSDLVATRLANARRRPVATLSRLLEPASTHTDAVFTAHPDGPELRTLLAQIAAALASDLTKTTRLVEILQAGNSHLKRIVATQQSLARTTHLSEFFVLREALQQALLLARTLSRQPTPIDECPVDATPVYADRSLVVQILLNLLINAHDAIAAHGPATPRISLIISPVAAAGLLAIEVTDNGTGIPEDQLFAIFTYGYTTKATGNGFGLHNSANAARLMGGELTVTSPGPGLGATFTLRLPTQPPAHAHHEN